MRPPSYGISSVEQVPMVFAPFEGASSYHVLWVWLLIICSQHREKSTRAFKVICRSLRPTRKSGQKVPTVHEEKASGKEGNELDSIEGKEEMAVKTASSLTVIGQMVAKAQFALDQVIAIQDRDSKG